MNIHSSVYQLCHALKPSSKKGFGRMIFAIPALLLVGCIIGGTGTDTDNGLRDKSGSLTDSSLNQPLVQAHILDSTSKPIMGVILTALDINYRPDTAKSLAPAILVPKDTNQKSVVSNSLGEANFRAKGLGRFVIEGTKDGKSLFFDTLTINDSKLVLKVTYTTSRLRSFQGKVRLTSGMHIDSGKVFIRGTNRYVNIDGAGVYQLGLLPANVEHMGLGVRFVSSPTSVLEVKPSLVLRDSVLDKQIPPVAGYDSLKLIYTCKDLSGDSAAKLSMPPLASAPNTSPADTSIQAGSKVLADSARFNAAVKSCDSIPPGALVNVTVTEKRADVVMAKPELQPGIFLVTQSVPSNSVSMNPGSVVTSPVIPYNQCVTSPGAEKTSFGISFQDPLLGNGLDHGDLLVQDLPSACSLP